MIIALSGKKQAGKDTVCKIIQYLIFHSKTMDKEGWTYQAFLEEFDFKPISEEDNQINRDEISKWQSKLFADKLKDIVCLLIGCTREQLEDSVFKETPLEGWGVTYLYSPRLNKQISPITISIEEAKLWLGQSPYTQMEDRLEVKSELLTPRKILQLMGTECGRNIIHPNIWVNALMSEYKGTHSSYKMCTYPIKHNEECLPNWIITDVRFPNEIKAIKDRGGIVIRVNREIPTIKCNNCNWIGTEEELQWVSPVVRNPEEDFKACPRCLTDSGLMDIEQDTHPSEISLDNYKEFDYTIDNNDSINILIQIVKTMLEQLKLL